MIIILRTMLAALCCASLAAFAGRLTSEQITETCANADGPAHCGRLIESVQLQRLPGLARREGDVLTISLYPSGGATFTDVDQGDNARSYSLWDAIDPINAVVLYTTTKDAVTFTLLQRRTNRRFSLPAEPVLSPDRQRLVTVDVCPKQCSNEIAVWRFVGDNLRKELVWAPGSDWIDAGAQWKDADALSIEYTIAGQKGDAKLERKLGDAVWTRLPPP
jgi:hypothetical protein